MARNVNDLEAILQVAFSKAAYSMSAFSTPIPYNEALASSEKPLRIGYLMDSDIMSVGPWVKRAILRAKGILEEKGHELIEF